VTTTRRIIVFISILAILAGSNIIASLVAIQANNDKIYAYQSMHSLSSSLYEFYLSNLAMLRLMRRYVITEGEDAYRLYWEEMEHNRIEQLPETFITFNASPNEIELVENLLYRRTNMTAIEKEVFRLHSKGYIQEAINLAHGSEFTYYGRPLQSIIQNVSSLSQLRIQKLLDAAILRFNISASLVIITLPAFVLTSILGFIKIGKPTISRSIQAFILLLVLLAGINLFFSLSIMGLSIVESDLHQLHNTLITSVYSVEQGTETLARIIRLFVINASEFHYYLYLEELEIDRFGRALDTFITLRAPDNEINMLVELVFRTTTLRQIESHILQLFAVGHVQEAIDIAFGPELVAVGIPTNYLSQELRKLVDTRIRESLYDISFRYNIYKTLAYSTMAMLVITSIAGLVTKLRQSNKHIPYSTPCLFKKMKNATIASRLVASFGLIIFVFVIYVIIHLYFNAVIENLNAHSLEFMGTRVEVLLTFHQEFTEMRRLLGESFMNSEWLANANESIWRSFEQRISLSHSRLIYLAEVYKSSITNDLLFPEMPDDNRIYTMASMMNFVNTIYEIYSSNFFLSGDMTFYHGDVLNYTGAAETMLQMLLHINAVHREIIEENIRQYRVISLNVTVATLMTAIVLALYLSYLMVNTFTSRIKAIEINATLVEQGNFEATLQNENKDEISKIFASLVKVSKKLIDEINDVTAENKKGNINARISQEYFKGGYKDTALAINTLLDAIATMIDSERKMQIAQENNQAKSKFLANMSHEIRTPLAAVLGITELHLYGSNLSMEIEEAFAKIHSSASTLLSIVNDILDLSKIEAGKMEIINDKYEVATLLNDVYQLNLVYLGNKELDFIFDVDEKLPAYLIGDELRIKQVLNNLLSNAFKYTENGFVSFKIFTNGNSSYGYTSITIVISDTGLGMTEEQLHTIFDEYSRFHDKARNVHIMGAGLGMPITHNLLKMMNATISVDSKVGKGTTVTVVLPQQIGSNETLGIVVAKQPRNFNVKTQSVSKKFSFKPEPMPYGRVLVVDDVDVNIYVAKGLLSLYHLQIDTCTSGQSAIQKIERGEIYDIIFMDQMMSYLNGTETTSIIRRLDYKHPIVALTANALVGQAEEFLCNGFDGFLSKPIQSTHLNAVLNKFIRDKYMPTLDDFHAINPAGTNLYDEAKYTNIDAYFDNYIEDLGMYREICKNFVRSQKNVISKINEAIQINDIKTAHLLVHTLKGLAGLIRENELINIAEKTELALSNGAIPENLLASLDLKLEFVLSKLEALYVNEE